MAGAAHAETKLAGAKRPNVVIFLADDLGYGDLACHGNPHVKTPSLDAFARDAVELSRFYVSPICSPTRASLLTGRHSARTFSEVAYHMHPEEVTIAEILRDAGYKTGLFGKWHLGDGPNECPQAQGFQEVVTFPKGKLPAKSYFNPQLLHNGQPQKYEGYCMDVLTTAAIDFIKQHRADPLFVYLPANLIHNPLVAPAELVATYKDAGLRGDVSKLYGMVNSLDGNFGRLRAALKELGLEENTLLIFASDNGPAVHTPAEVERMAGLHGMKGTVYEGGIRTMCMLRWPANLHGDRKIEVPAAHVDLLPTIAEACAAPLPAGVRIDGRSLLPLLRDRSAPWPERSLIIQYDSDGPPRPEMAFAVITAKWKLVQPCGAAQSFKGLDGVYAKLSAAAGRGKRTISGNAPRFELYDIPNDPGETKNLAAELPEIVQMLKKTYHTWFSDIREQARWREPAAEAKRDGQETP
jgi:arylsulfatase A-like enzyme